MISDAKYLNDIEKEALAQIENRISARFGVWKYILFGSKARGDFRQDSDIDLLIVTDRKLTWREKDAIISNVYEVNLLFGTLYTAQIVIKDDWEQGRWTCLPLKQSIDKDGILV